MQDMKKRILLIGYNFYPEPTGIGKYSGEMMPWLANHGYECSVLTAYPYYPYWQVQPPYEAKSSWYLTEKMPVASPGSLTVHRVPMFIPKSPSGLKRILLDMSFSVTAFLKLTQLLVTNKFDYVIAIAPSFQFGLLGVIGQKIWKAKLIYHIQDMQIEAARDLHMIKSTRIINWMFRVEKYIFDHADTISSISEGMVDRIAQKAQKPVTLFPNWADVNLIYPLPDRAALKVEFGLAGTNRVVLYSGAIGEKQGLEAILYAAQSFALQPDVKFVICGSGPYEKNLRALADSLQLHNVVFLPLQPVTRLNALLNMADVHLVIQKANTSDLVMPSKLTNILSVGGLAIVTANPDSTLYKLVKKYDIGLLVEAENQTALNAGLEKALGSDMLTIRHNARAYAEQYLAIDNVMHTFEQEVLSN
jgi:colanic acid biosynthesis glycosyl transferase WcaI